MPPSVMALSATGHSLSHFGSIETAIQGDFTVSNPCTGEPHVFLMDPSVSVGTVLNIFKINIIHQLSQHR